MISDFAQPNTGLLFSGGLDSTILLGRLLDEGECVQPFYVRSQLVWEREEIEAVEWLLARWASPRLAQLVVLEMPLADLYGDHWSVTGHETPRAGTPDEAVYLPGRNALLLIKAAMWCQMRRIPQLALGSLASNPFADATPAFFDQFAATLHRATGLAVRFVRPLERFTKPQVMELGRHYPLERTFSCLAPREGLHCGQCNKCAERQEAFRSCATGDPTHYFALQPSGNALRAAP